jgi:hypothetical protein
MVTFLIQLLLAIRSRFARRARLEAENLALRQQFVALRRKSPTRVRLWNIDRLLIVSLYRVYPSLLDAIIIVQPETVIRWHRRGFRAYWHWKSRNVGGRPRIDSQIRALIRRMSRENPPMGRTSNPRQIVDAWNRSRGVHRQQVHGPAPPTTFSRLEDFPAQSCRLHRFA